MKNSWRFILASLFLLFALYFMRNWFFYIYDGSFPSDVPTSFTEVEGVWWILKPSEDSLQTKRLPVVLFKNGKLFGYTECNYYEGSYFNNQENLRFENVLSTLAGCPTDESIYLNQLRGTIRFEASETILNLHNDEFKITFVQYAEFENDTRIVSRNY